MFPLWVSVFSSWILIAKYRPAKGAPKIVHQCNLPLTSMLMRRVDMVVTELAVINFGGCVATLLETGPGSSVAQVVAATEAKLAISDRVPEMVLP